MSLESTVEFLELFAAVLDNDVAAREYKFGALSNLTDGELEEAITVTCRMIDVLKKYPISPQPVLPASWRLLA